MPILEELKRRVQEGLSDPPNQGPAWEALEELYRQAFLLEEALGTDGWTDATWKEWLDVKTLRENQDHLIEEIIKIPCPNDRLYGDPDDNPCACKVFPINRVQHALEVIKRLQDAIKEEETRDHPSASFFSQKYHRLLYGA